MDILKDWIKQNPLLLSIVSFIAGIVFRELILDRFYHPLNKNRIKQQIASKGLPQIYTVEIKNTVDIERIARRLRECVCLLSCEFAISGDDKSCVQLKTQNVNPEAIDPSKQNIRFIHIDNCTDSPCNVCAVNETMKREVKFVSELLSYIKAHEGIGLIFNEYQHPTNIVVDYNGVKILYEITSINGSVRGTIL